MSDFIEITWTTGSLEEARKISRNLVQEKYVASAKIIPFVESIYLWNNELETTQDCLVIFKTDKIHFEKIKEIITKQSTYEIPEMTFKHIAGGNAEYLSWIKDTIKP